MDFFSVLEYRTFVRFRFDATFGMLASSAGITGWHQRLASLVGIISEIHKNGVKPRRCGIVVLPFTSENEFREFSGSRISQTAIKLKRCVAVITLFSSESEDREFESIQSK